MVGVEFEGNRKMTDEDLLLLHPDLETAKVKSELITLLPASLDSARIHKREKFSKGREYLEVHLVLRAK